MRNRINGSSELTGRFDKLQDVTEYASLPDTCLGAEHHDFAHPICLFGPERYEPRYNYPLIVWLHSCRSSELELEQVMRNLSMQNYVACAPRGTLACTGDSGLFRWGQSATSAAIAEEVIFEAIEQASAQFSVAPDRIFLAGFGGGGSLAWRVALRYSKRFAGVLSLCGNYPLDHQSLTNLDAARELPTLWMYGAESERCGISQVCDALPVMHAARLAVDIRQYPCGDELLSNMLLDANGWLMEQITHQPAAFANLPVENFSRN